MSEETSLVNLTIRVPKMYRDALHALLSGTPASASDYVRRAINEAVQRDFGQTLPGEVRPHGKRRDYEERERLLDEIYSSDIYMSAIRKSDGAQVVWYKHETGLYPALANGGGAETRLDPSIQWNEEEFGMFEKNKWWRK